MKIAKKLLPVIALTFASCATLNAMDQEQKDALPQENHIAPMIAYVEFTKDGHYVGIKKLTQVTPDQVDRFIAEGPQHPFFSWTNGVIRLGMGITQTLQGTVVIGYLVSSAIVSGLMKLATNSGS